MQKKGKKVYVAMSGGVDSSVAAALLIQKGYSVTGVFFKPWQPKGGRSFCNWQHDRQDALAVATHLGIQLKTWDLSKEYGKHVTRKMITDYRNGLTPNPDVLCNKNIKFGIFLKKALAEGADFISTGHYARVRHGKKISSLFKAKDKNKDQTYFLYTLTQKELKHCLFPIGPYTKPEVRVLARTLQLVTYDKKDSQGVCFVGELNMKDFLSQYIKPKSGEIKLLDGSTVGQHDGASYYTIGQRHGLNIKNGKGPFYVAKKDIKKNIIYVVTDTAALGRDELLIEDVTWIEPSKHAIFSAKIRYRTQEVNARRIGQRVKFSKPVRAAAQGQSVVFYKGQKVLGGGIIRG